MFVLQLSNLVNFANNVALSPFESIFKFQPVFDSINIFVSYMERFVFLYSLLEVLRKTASLFVPFSMPFVVNIKYKNFSNKFLIFRIIPHILLLFALKYSILIVLLLLPSLDFTLTLLLL